MSVHRYPPLGPTALGLITAPVDEPRIPYGASLIQPKESFCKEHGKVNIIAEYGHIDILSCGCEFDTRG